MRGLAPDKAESQWLVHRTMEALPSLHVTGRREIKPQGLKSQQKLDIGGARTEHAMGSLRKKLTTDRVAITSAYKL